MSITTIYDSDHHDEKTVTFPWIGKSGDLIVLFTAKDTGVVISTNDSRHGIGYVSYSWVMENFKPLPEGEKVILQNNWEWGNGEA